MKLNFQIRKRAKALWLWLRRKDAFVFLLFAGLVSIFWWGRMMSSPKDITITIPVTYSGYSDQFVFDQELPKTLTLDIRDIGRNLRSILNQDLRINIDLSPYLHKEKARVRLNEEELRLLVKRILPNSTTILKVTPKDVSFDYHIQPTKKVDVDYSSIEISTAPQYQIVGNISMTPSQVQIFGDQSVIDSISTIYAESLQVTDLREAFSTTVDLIAPTGVRVQPSSVSITCSVEQYTEKSFTVPIHVQDLPEYEDIQVFPDEVKVAVRVGLPHYDAVTEDDIEVICHYKENAAALELEVITNNPYITKTRLSKSFVEYYYTTSIYEEDSDGGSADAVPTY